MDLSSATPAQKEIITTLDAPLAVAAGAGSGKTFTLTNRIGYALVGDQANSMPYISSIEEVLAITFTRAGADELKSRIRSLLQNEGLEAQARAVDDAWITTIHGMCSRILREHALELGIDPRFEVVEDVEAKNLRNQAIEAVLRRISEDESNTRFSRLFEWFPKTSSKQGDSGLPVYLIQLWEKTLSLPGGFESTYLPDLSIDLALELRKLIELSQQFQGMSDLWEGKITKYEEAHRNKNADALEAAYNYQQNVDLSRASFADPCFDMTEYLDIALGFTPATKNFRKGKPDEDFFNDYKTTYAQIAQNIVANAALALSKDLLDLTKLVDEEYQRLKGAEALDNTDLLRKCLEALESQPELRSSYQDQFKMIMIDEFQDTDLLQVAIIDMLSRNHGINVATVGDAQQSIYRFRGANVEVFFQHRKDQQQKHAGLKAISLPDNFRSHGDILAFVDKIFSGNEFFGDEFLSLRPKGDVAKEQDPIFDDYPRVSVNVVESRQKGGSLAMARTVVADSIAQHFSELRARGASPREMVILLGAMSNVSVYQQALADAGFESIVTAGSVFGEAPEVKLMVALLRAVADHTNSTSLYQVLESPLFNISDATLFALGTCAIPEMNMGRSASFAKRAWCLIRGFKSSNDSAFDTFARESRLSDSEKKELTRAFRLLARFDTLAHNFKINLGLKELITHSGWSYRLQARGADGLAIASNIFKGLDIVADLEQEQRSLTEIADDFKSYVELSKQPPGVLSTLESDFVRIMTIHASKGLEFGHVAVSEIRNGLPKSNAFEAETVSDSLLVSLSPTLSNQAGNNYKGLRPYFGLRAFDPDGAFSLDSLSVAELDAFRQERIRQAELDDAQRLLYVALTRASKSLFLCLPFTGNKNFDYERNGMLGLLADLLKWERSPEFKRELFEYGGSAKAVITHQVLTEKGEIRELERESSSDFVIPKLPDARAEEVFQLSIRHDVASYSSIAPDHHGDCSESEEISAQTEHAASSVSPVAPDPYSVFEDEEPMFPDDDAQWLTSKRAFALGLAFHRLAQRLIETRVQVGVVPELPLSSVEAQIRLESLDSEQEGRLRDAISRWMNSNLIERFMSFQKVRAEVPFMVELESDTGSFFLEGEIDGLAFDSEEMAFFIDYKTGGTSEETDAQLYGKHLLQAQCYSLALLRQGFSEVEANFIRVEREDPGALDQPQVVVYKFTRSDQEMLEKTIMAAYQAKKAN